MTHPYYSKTVDNGYTPAAEKEYKRIADMQSAAAPDLLAALQRISSWLYTDLLHPQREICRDSAAKAYSDACAAIAKAKGA